MRANEEPQIPLSAEDLSLAMVRMDLESLSDGPEEVAAALGENDLTVSGLSIKIEEDAQSSLSAQSGDAQCEAEVGPEPGSISGHREAEDLTTGGSEVEIATSEAITLPGAPVGEDGVVLVPSAEVGHAGDEGGDASHLPDIEPEDSPEAVTEGSASAPGCVAATRQFVAPSSRGRGDVPQFIPATGPIWLLVFADYPGQGPLLTGIPFWGEGPVSKMVCTALHRTGYCDEYTLEMAQRPAQDLANAGAVPNFRHVALTYLHDKVLEGQTCSIEDVLSKRNLDRLRGVLDAATSRCPGPLRIVTMGHTAKFILRGILFGGHWDVDVQAIQSPSIGVGRIQFDEEAWVGWAKISMQTDYTL